MKYFILLCMILMSSSSCLFAQAHPLVHTLNLSNNCSHQNFSNLDTISFNNSWQGRTTSLKAFALQERAAYQCQIIINKLANVGLYNEFYSIYKQIPPTIENVSVNLKVLKNAHSSQSLLVFENIIKLRDGCAIPKVEQFINGILQELKPLIFDQYGYLKQSLSKKEIKKIDAAIKEFKKNSSEWHSSIYAPIDIGNHLLDNPKLSNVLEIPTCLKNTEFDDYAKMKQLCSTHDQEQAYNLVLKYKHRASASGYDHFNMLYQKEFAQDILNDTAITKVTYVLNNEVAELLSDYAIDPTEYIEFTSDAAGHALHNFDLKALERAASLKNKGFDSFLQETLESCIQTNFLVHGYITKREYDQAYHTTILLHSAYTSIGLLGHYGYEVCGGIKDGLLQSMMGIYHLIRHPLKSAYNFLKLTDKIVEFSTVNAKMLAYPLLTPEEQKVLLTDYKAYISPIIKTISNATVRDCSREITSFLVGSKLLRTCHQIAKPIVQTIQNKLITVAGQEAIEVEVIASTAEGIEIKAATSESVGLGEIENITSSEVNFLYFSEEVQEQAVKYVMDTKISHIFKKLQHKLDPLVKKLGGEEKTVRAILKESQGKLPKEGLFKEIPIQIDEFTVYIRGRVMDGVPKIGTFFIK